MAKIGISASSRMAAEAGARVADRGGNAVDAAVAASMVSLCTDFAFVSPGASGFVALWHAGDDPVLLDAYAEVPGRGLSPDAPIGRGRQVGAPPGMSTLVGYETVATPGGIKGLAAAVERGGRLSWAEVIEPAIAQTERGVPMTTAGETYFRELGDQVFGWHPESRRILSRADGDPLRAGDHVDLTDLARTLRQLARDGIGSLYGGELGHSIASDIARNGGRLTLEDLEAYEVIDRAPICVTCGDWSVAVNPPPAVGGVTLAALLLALAAPPIRAWGPTERRRFVDAQRAVLTYRRHHLHGGDNAAAAMELLRSMGMGRRATGTSPSTVQASAVDTDGNACAITLSDGYGSGVVIPGTGFALNNALGEMELMGGTAAPPGTRLVSNMAPTIARHPDGSVLAIGSPGAARITTTVAQVLVQVLDQGLDLAAAVRVPRLHLDVSRDPPVVNLEEGVPPDAFDDPELRHPSHNVYFGSAQAVAWRPDRGLEGAVDPRRDAHYAEGGAP